MIKEILKDDYIYQENSTEDSISKINHNFSDLDNRKVEKENWKRLSTNDFTDDLKLKLEWIPAWWGSSDSPYTKVQDIRDTNRAPNDPFWKNHHIHYWFIQPNKIWLSSSWGWCTIITINW